MPKYKSVDIVVSAQTASNGGNSDLLKYSDYYDEYEPNYLCPACHGTGLDEWEFEDCPVCWGDGEIRQGGLTGRR